MKKYEIPLMQEIYEKLCSEFTKYNTYIKVAKEQYRLVFLTEDTLREKYKGIEIMSEVGIA